MKTHKLGVIVPYRERIEHLQLFEGKINNYLSERDLDFVLIVVEQGDDLPFNRGWLLNIGFVKAKELGCDYVVFHDVDMLPMDVDYSYSDIPLHLATNFTFDGNNERVIFDDYFGGVTLFPVEVFESINGFSNEYHGWGFEDTDLLYRCKLNGVPLDAKHINTKGGRGAALAMDGQSTFVMSDNFFVKDEDFSIFVSFSPSEILCDKERDYDVFPIFSIPGYDLKIAYNSFRRYFFQAFDSNHQYLQIVSEIKPPYKTNATITYKHSEGRVRFYQDGVLVGEKTIQGFWEYESEPFFYLGVDNFNIDRPTFFKGSIDSFGVFDCELQKEEVLSISNNRHFGLTMDFDEYASSEHLKLCYDSKAVKDGKFIDLGYGNSEGVIKNGEIKAPYLGSSQSSDLTQEVVIPFRRQCVFTALKHEENGYLGGGWKDASTRHNEVRYHNEVVQGKIDIKADGLSSLSYKVTSSSQAHKRLHIVVENMKHKLGVCIPYRDREDHIKQLIPHLSSYLNKQGIAHRFYVAHQADDTLFNRGAMKNLAAKVAFDDGCDYIAWHDVDMLPIEQNGVAPDYSYPADAPTHIATKLSKYDYGIGYDQYFGGVVLFTKEQVMRTNGYSNDYWDWGQEDDDLFWRAHFENYTINNTLWHYKDKAVAEFNGMNSFISIPCDEQINEALHQDHAVSILFKAEQQLDKAQIWMVGDENKRFIEYPLFRKDGSWSYGMSFNNSRAVTMTVFDRNNTHHYNYAKRFEDLWTWVTLSYSSETKQYSFFLNDEVTCQVNGTKQNTPFPVPIEPKHHQSGKPFLLGFCNHQNTYFKGKIGELKIFNKHFKTSGETHTNKANLLLHYDFSNGVRDKISNTGAYCANIRMSKESIDVIGGVLPHRREGMFDCLPHIDEGYSNGGWVKGKTTARNERRFVTEMQQGKIDYKKEGICSVGDVFEIVNIDTEQYPNTVFINCKLR
jgi:hypothetical protein